MDALHVGAMLAARAALTPDRIAIEDGATGRSHSFADLDRRARSLAFALLRRGVGAGDRVALLSRNHVAFVDLVFACARLGAIFAPLNWRLTPTELAFAVGDAQPRVLVYAEEFASAAKSIADGSSIEHAVAMGPEYASLVTTPRPLPTVAISGDTPLCLLYTSGTTGRPKGALIPHRQVIWNCINTAASWGLTDRDVAPVLTPMFHAGGLFVFVTPLIHTGGRSILCPDFDVEGSLRLLEEHRCTVALAVPTILQTWLDAPSLSERDLSAMRWFVSGGAPCPPALIEAWHDRHGIVVRQGYGMTEVGVNCFAMQDEDARRKPGTVGRPVLYGRARIVDGNGHEVADGTPGELLLGGPHVCLGYWNRPDATAETIRDGWFHTGDMAVRDGDGDFAIVGRYKDMIISGGENVYAAEVEAVLREHPSVADAALLGRPDPKWGEVGWVVVKPEAGATLDAASLLAHCGARLAKYKVPKRVLERAELPYSAYGKVDKKALRAWLDDNARA